MLLQRSDRDVLNETEALAGTEVSARLSAMWVAGAAIAAGAIVGIGLHGPNGRELLIALLGLCAVSVGLLQQTLP